MMSTRIAKAGELQLLTCLKHGLWGANKLGFEKWKVGDILIFTVDKQLTGYAEISGESYLDDEVIWDNGLFWNRIPITFKYLLKQEDRITVQGEIKSLLIKEWGDNYGWGILNKQPLSSETSDALMSKITAKPNSLQYYIDNLNNN